MRVFWNFGREQYFDENSIFRNVFLITFLLRWWKNMNCIFMQSRITFWIFFSRKFSWKRFLKNLTWEIRHVFCVIFREKKIKWLRANSLTLFHDVFWTCLLYFQWYDVFLKEFEFLTHFLVQKRRPLIFGKSTNLWQQPVHVSAYSTDMIDLLP
jgi:hypothetical protein